MLISMLIFARIFLNVFVKEYYTQNATIRFLGSFLVHQILKRFSHLKTQNGLEIVSIAKKVIVDFGENTNAETGGPEYLQEDSPVINLVYNE